MEHTKKMTGAALAVAAAGLLMTAVATPAVAAEEGKKVHCEGVNACKGNNDCKTAKNACKGQGACKGHGFVEMTKEQCTKIGGKMEGEKKDKK